jgi:aspartyl-tRNA(Asn)/glutamyl-tRNA(Gln) amidotransferase subunit B
MQYAGLSDCDMEKGQMRCDVNLSVRRPGTPLNKKTEVKNLNSFKAVHRAILYEIERQAEMLEAGTPFVQTTRGWDDTRGETFLQRVKENADDYRYFPCPDLMPMQLGPELLAELRATLPEHPAERLARLVTQYGLSTYDAEVLTLEKATADYFEAVVQGGAPAKKAANWVMGELKAALAEAGREIADSPITAAHLAALVKLIEAGTINGKIAKTVFAEMFESGQSPEAIVKAKGLVQVADEGAIAELVRQVIAAHPGPAAEFRQGKEQSLNFLVGQVMKLSRGKANPQLATRLLRDELSRP